MNTITEEYSPIESISIKEEATCNQLLKLEIKSEPPDLKCDINSVSDGYSVKQELLHAELDIKTEICDSHEEQEDYLSDYKTSQGHKLQQKIIETRKKEKPFKRDYRNASKLNLQKTHTRKNSYNCNHCDFNCSRKSILKSHSKTYAGKKITEIEDHHKKVVEHDYKSSFKHGLQRRTRAERKSYECGVCDYKCRQKCNLQRHMKTHTGEKPFKCNLCDYKSAEKSVLQRHMVTHTGDKPFKCNLCDFKFPRKYILEKHIRTHTGEKPFKCNICDYKAVQKSSLQLHLRTHTGEKPYSCNLCDYKCTARRYLKTHVEKHSS